MSLSFNILYIKLYLILIICKYALLVNFGAFIIYNNFKF